MTLSSPKLHREPGIPGEVVDFPSGRARMIGHLDIERLRGVRPIRLPRACWSRFPPNSEIPRTIVCNASGVRLLIRTHASVVRLTVRCTRVDIGEFIGPVNYFVAEVQGRIVARALANVDSVEAVEPLGASTTVRALRDRSTMELGPLPSGEKEVTIWLPQGMIVDILDVSGDGGVVPGVPAQRPIWLHHGSSISHCASIEMPTSSWPVVAARVADLELLNLGFGGNCMLDPFVAEVIAATPADVISLKVGVNIVGARTLDRRTFVPALHGFLDRIRQGHPSTPIVVSSSILWPGSEDKPGPSDVDFLGDGKVRCYTAGDSADVDKGALTMESSRRQIALTVAIRRAEGDNIFYMDGLALYGPKDEATFVMPDMLHPGADLYEEIGRRFAKFAFGEKGLVPRSMIVRETVAPLGGSAG